MINYKDIIKEMRQRERERERAYIQDIYGLAILTLTRRELSIAHKYIAVVCASPLPSCPPSPTMYNRLLLSAYLATEIKRTRHPSAVEFSFLVEKIFILPCLRFFFFITVLQVCYKLDLR